MRRHLLIISFLIVYIFSSSILFAKENEKEDYYDDYERFVRVVKVILEKYVDEIDIKDLFQNAYKGMMSGLDPYSQFYLPEDLADLKIETEGEFEGLGIEVVIRKGMLIVISPIVDSPAMSAGILAGDMILKIDGVPTENLSFQDVIKCLRGKPGSEVTLTVLHKGETEPLDITIKRGKIHVNSVRGARIVDDAAKIGYIAITNFQDHTVEDLKRATRYLRRQGMESLVLDLRFNPGGLLNVAVDVADQILKEGIIVSTKSRDPAQNAVFNAYKRGCLVDYPLVILVNNGSASASEIVAGAVKDNKRGTLVGNRTFGKGSVQSLLPIDGGKSALKLTTARYYTPSGASIHEKGIEPDINIELSVKEIKELHENLAFVNSVYPNDRSGKNRLNGKVNSKFKDKQLESAINSLKKFDLILDSAFHMED